MSVPPIVNQFAGPQPYKLFSGSNTILNTFTPSNLTNNLALWLDAAPNSTPDLSGNFYNFDLSGDDYVFRWRDKSPNKYNALCTNSDMSTAPIFDGNNGIFFSNQVLTSTQGLYTNYTGSAIESIFIVCKPSTITEGSVIISSDISGGRSIFIDLYTDLSGTLPYFFIGSNEIKPLLRGGYTPLNERILTESLFNSPLSNFKTYTNGRNTSSITDGIFSISTAVSNIIGLGNFNTSNSKWGFNGIINEILIYSNILSDTERQKIESYLGYKWGLTLNSQNPYYQVIYSNYAYPLLNCNYFTISSVTKSAPINVANYPFVSNYFVNPPYALKNTTF